MEPEAAELFLLQGLVHEGRGQLEKAAEQLQEAIVRNPDLVLPYYNLGRVMAQLGEFVPAIRCLTRVTEMEPENVDAYYMLGIAFHEYGDLPSAIASFNRVVQLQPDHLDGYATLADLLVEVGDLPLAMEALNAGLNECQHHASLLEKASAVCMHAGKFANALEYTEQIVETMPTYERGWLNLAHLCILTEDLERSEEAGKQAIACAPDGWEGYYHLGNLYEATKLFDLAEEHYRLAVSRAPSEEFRPMANLAAVLMQVDDKEKNKEAVSLLEEVLPLVPPGDYRFHFNLALAHGKLGARNVAKRLIKEIREALPEDDELVGAAEALENNLFSAKEQLDMSLALESMMTGGRPRPISPVGKPVAKDDKDKSPKK
jgi:tetratricopeptide (TPR) repeat protein